MALTLTAVTGASYKNANKRVRVYDVTFDSSYASAGEPLVASDVGMHKIDQAIAHGMFRKSDGSDAIDVSYDYTNNVLVALRGKDPANAGGADVPFPKVTSTTDLSAYSGRMTFIGF